MIFVAVRQDHLSSLISFLRKHSKGQSARAIKRAIDAGRCKINGKIETFSTHLVHEGDKIEITLPTSTAQIKPSILYEDEDLILYNKPSGITSEKFSPYLLVHRLDKGTSGVMIFAKNTKVQMALIDLFRERKVEKTYFALCDGHIAQKEWIMDNYLEKKAVYQGGTLYGRAPKGRGKRAITHFTTMQTSFQASLVKAHPLTGRTHQIRVHLQLRGHPVLGDIQYGRQFQCTHPFPRLMLHSYEIIFTHPTHQEKIACIAPLPNDFLEGEKILFGA